MTRPTTAPGVTGPPPLKGGIASTEFWLTLIGTVVLLLTGLNVIGPDFADKYKQVIDALALLGSILGPAIYALARGMAKKGHQQAVASVFAASIHANAQMVTQGLPPAQAAAATKAAVDATPTPADSGYSLVGLLAYIAALVLVAVGLILIIIEAVARHPHLSVTGVVMVVIGVVIALVASALGKQGPVTL